MKNKILTVLLAAFWLSSLAQCGEKNGLSKDIEFTLIPNNPVVVFSDLTLNPGATNEFTATAPWFLFQSKIENQSTNRLYIVTLRFQGTGVKNNGLVAVDVSIDPSVACSATGRAYLTILDSGETYVSSSPCDGDQPSAVLPYESWYISDLPATDNGSYSLEVSGEGWFVDFDGVPIERLTMSAYMLTQ